MPTAADFTWLAEWIKEHADSDRYLALFGAGRISPEMESGWARASALFDALCKQAMEASSMLIIEGQHARGCGAVYGVLSECNCGLVLATRFFGGLAEYAAQDEAETEEEEE